MLILVAIILAKVYLESPLEASLTNNRSYTLLLHVLQKKDDSEFYLVKPRLKEGIYDNPWSTSNRPGFQAFIKFSVFEKNNIEIPSDPKVLDEYLPVHYTTKEEIDDFFKEDSSNKSKIIWIGHASALVNFQNKIILFDPVFSERCSPSKYVGPKRYRPVPFKIDDILRVDAVVISHSHYDHLDEQSILDLNSKFKGINWFFGLGLAEWFETNEIRENVHEFGWWEMKKINGLEFVFVPAQHWSGRGLLDRNKSLWGGWVIIGNRKRFYFAGDSGYCPVFKDIGRKLGPFDFSFIPIGAYNPRWFMKHMHVNPEEAVKIHMEVKSKKSFAIHWGTFPMSYEPYLEPKRLLAESLKNVSLDENEFITLKHGAIYKL